MKKYIVGIIIILLLIVGLIIYFINNKETEYTPIVDYEDNIVWEDIERTDIVFNDEEVSSEGEGFVVSGNTITIKSGGSYYLSGEYNGNIIVDSKSTVYLVLNNLTVNAQDNAAIYVENAEKVVINVLEETTNTLTDKSTYDETEEGINAVIYSKDDLVIMGSGSLNITASYQHGISCKDTLQIMDVFLQIKAVNDAIRGKDYLAIKSGNFTIETESDGLKSTNENDTSLGYVVIDGGTFNIDVKGDAIGAITSLTINSGEFTIKTGNGSTTSSSLNSTSSKGIKAGTSIIIKNGTINLNTADDAIHSNDSVIIYNGTINISSGDDGIHADSSIKIENGTINITKSYEGIEAKEITINNGNISVISSDDGINCAGGNDSSSLNRPGANQFQSGDGKLYINGGTIYLNTQGDGIDINGSGVMTGGTVVVDGPTNSGNGALDYDGTFNVNGGILIASGASGMVQTPSNGSGQYSLSITFNTSVSANEIIHIEDSSGNEIITYSSSKSFQNVIISTPDLKKETYSIYYGGSYSGNKVNGIYTNGTYQKGTLYKTVSISSVITSVGSQSSMGTMPRR